MKILDDRRFRCAIKRCTLPYIRVINYLHLNMTSLKQKVDEWNAAEAVNLTNEAVEGIAPSMNVREDLRASF